VAPQSDAAEGTELDWKQGVSPSPPCPASENTVASVILGSNTTNYMVTTIFGWWLVGLQGAELQGVDVRWNSTSSPTRLLSHQEIVFGTDLALDCCTSDWTAGGGSVVQAAVRLRLWFTA